MGTRNVERFIDKSAVPYIITIPFAGVTDADEPDGISVQSAVISQNRDFYGFVVRSTSDTDFTFLLTDGGGEPLSDNPIDGIDANNTIELVRNLGESGRLVPLFVPKGGRITVVVHKPTPGTATGVIEVRGVLIDG